MAYQTVCSFEAPWHPFLYSHHACSEHFRKDLLALHGPHRGNTPTNKTITLLTIKQPRCGMHACHMAAWLGSAAINQAP